MSKHPCVYMLASRRNGTLYIGVTSDLVKRVWEHRNDLAEGFTKRYGVHTLVWYELHEEMPSAIAREKAMKEWKRRWKLDLIERDNPEWRDLYENVLGLDSGSGLETCRDRFRETVNPPVVVTAYRTGKITKYWRKP